MAMPPASSAASPGTSEATGNVRWRGRAKRRLRQIAQAGHSARSASSLTTVRPLVVLDVLHLRALVVGKDLLIDIVLIVVGAAGIAEMLDGVLGLETIAVRLVIRVSLDPKLLAFRGLRCAGGFQIPRARDCDGDTAGGGDTGRDQVAPPPWCCGRDRRRGDWE